MDPAAGNFLERMANASRARAAALTAGGMPESGLPVVPLRLAGFDLIAETKERSPSEGVLAAAGTDRVARAAAYAGAGAAAISVLTEPAEFGGDIGHLRAVAEALQSSGVPVMRKDFLVDPLQIREARSAGASGVLLIAAILDDAALADMLDCAYGHDLFVLLEAFDGEELARCAELLEEPRHRDAAGRHALLVGVNSRDLKNLAVDSARLGELARELPDGVVCVAESGLETPDDVAACAALGYRAALVGTALMRSADPAGLIRDMLDAGWRGTEL